jgi:hypothetical protein
MLPALAGLTMRVICAWCQQEGRSGLLRVREPLDDPTETHGICDRHQQAVFETFPSSSFPATRWLFIVPPGDAARYDHLAKLLKDVPGATVIVDRRRGERRGAAEPGVPERRRFERRVRRAEFNGLGYGLIRFAVRGGTSGAASPPPSSSRAAVPDVRTSDVSPVTSTKQP